MNYPLVLIAAREVRQRGRSRVFLLSTLLVSGLLLVGVVLPQLFGDDATVDEPEALTIATVGQLDEYDRAALAALGAGVEIAEMADRAAAEAAVEADEAELAVIDGPSGPVVVVAATSDPFGDDVTRGTGGAAASLLGQAAVARDRGVPPDTIGQLATAEPAPVEGLDGGEDDQQAFVVANIAITFMYGTFLLYGMWIVSGIIEEKSSRVVEVLLGAVSPRELLGGKVLGLGLLGLGQVVAILAPALVVGVATDSSLLPPGVGSLAGVIVLWWLLGYGMWSTVMAALGSLVSRPEEAQAVATPATLFIVLSYFSGFVALANPDGGLSVAASLFPLTAPIAMLVRMAVADPPVWHVALAVASTAAAIFGFTALAARIYEGAILKTRGRVKLREAWSARQL